MIYKLLEDELNREGGVHALQLKTRTLVEEEAQAKREQEASANPAGSVA
jgi:stress-induced morphogen